MMKARSVDDYGKEKPWPCPWEYWRWSKVKDRSGKKRWRKVDRSSGEVVTPAQEKARRVAKREEVELSHRQHLETKRFLRAILEAGFRVLAAKAHPDRGGSDGEMRHLLEMRDRARHIIEFGH